MLDWGLLVCGAFLAGLVDAVVGGGGLILVPLLLSVMPEVSIPVLFGTNKLAAIAGTASAAFRYARRIEIPWHIVRPASVAALAGAASGAAVVSFLPPEAMRPLVLVLLLAVGLYVWLKPDFGKQAGKAPDRHTRKLASLAGFCIGFYDGFFGPGTGSFLIFCFVRWFGINMLQASASAKFVNLATNLAALIYFFSHEGVLWQLGLTMAVANIAGAQTGSHIALNRGNGFVRVLLLIMVSVLFVRLAWTYFFA
ncbi:MAG: hypothetical protein CGU29_09775 [Candidatus Dactylopiibacterium carminicum]|uniref:Probable membrane transporter protein n=1 Tax=Candidatus Dactylopiibacterium carminicum TaxID=857335 RepID=A0A272ES81_9RHOO|nr:TSUP family transporter [Candidatus Dactylopiibacterium carminicum]KAF7598930.1 hypothetical protein BGI27_10690 [Candidatus Dactylopiibacterium carminicum]PAS92906.1 MAG: hypothetical protein CGU29_09775 [Candidatus Dactylopiibacterium carminicum]PAS98946.1 MAG: hypothetical protein BSR46_10710 [Candidatus Dactylopiibacterium carminicum]